VTEPVVYRVQDDIAPVWGNDIQLVEVPADCIGADFEPMFGALKQRFPLEVAEG
jgi:hypothetical protein